MSEDKINRFLFIVLTIFIVIAGFVFLFLNAGFEKEKNVVNHKSINKGLGWENNTSHYSGSELSFAYDNSDSIAFRFSTKSVATQGVEIIINDESFTINSPNIDKQTLRIQSGKMKINNVLVKHFCTYFYDPCDIKITQIDVSSNSRIYKYIPHNKRLSVLGDSISTIYGKNNYTYLTAKKLGYELHSAAILGSSLTKIKGIDNLINRYEKDIKNYNSDIIVINIGSNDAAHNVSLETFKNNYLEIIKDIKKWHPESKIFLFGILPRKDVEPGVIASYNNEISAISSAAGVRFIDSSNWLEEKDYSDAIHPSNESQEKISDKFLSEINK